MTSRLRLLSTFIALGAGIALLHVAGPSGCSKNCGNGTLDAGEACDDGNTANGDGCNSSCEIESGGTTGGTTGGATTGGTTGGSASGECTTPADCPASFSAHSVCEKPSTCQGSRTDATCVDGVCGSIQVPDDSGCTADSFTHHCGPDQSLNPDVSCDGTVDQNPPFCAMEVCDDDSPIGVDDDGDGLTNCEDTVDCPPPATTCTESTGGKGACFAGLCQD